MTEPTTISTSAGQRPAKPWTVLLLVWMVGVMLLAWFVLDGPGISSITKRVQAVSAFRRPILRILGKPDLSKTPSKPSEDEE